MAEKRYLSCRCHHNRLPRLKMIRWRRWTVLLFFFWTSDHLSCRCCRHHDLACPIQIEPGETKHGLFNYRYHTVGDFCTLYTWEFVSSEKNDAIYPSGDALLMWRPVPLLLEDGGQPGLRHRRQLLLQRRQHKMLRVQDGGGGISLACGRVFTFLCHQVCEERNWWGVCLKRGQRAKAVWRQPVTY